MRMPAPVPPSTRLTGPSPFDELLDKHMKRGRTLRWEPIEWRPLRETPYLATPEGFRATLDRLWSECGFNSDLLFVDCDEPPCFGVIRGEINVNHCPGWIELFERTNYHITTHLPCSSGPMRLELMTPSNIMEEGLEDGITQEDVKNRTVPRFMESLDLEELCRIHEDSSP